MTVQPVGIDQITMQVGNLSLGGEPKKNKPEALPSMDDLFVAPDVGPMYNLFEKRTLDSHLRAVRFYRMDFTDRDVFTLRLFAEQLEDLSFLHCTKITNNCASAILQLRHLRHLNVYGCYQLSDEFMDKISPLTDDHPNAQKNEKPRQKAAGLDLESLNVGRCSFTAQILINIASMKRLRVLALDGCSTYYWTDPKTDTSKSLKINASALEYMVDSHPQLQELHLDDCEFVDDTAIPHLVKLPLTRLSLTNTSISPKGLEALAKYFEKTGTLKELSVSFCKNIQSQHLTCLLPLKLRVLNIFGCIVSQKDVSKLQSIPQLVKSVVLTNKKKAQIDAKFQKELKEAIAEETAQLKRQGKEERKEKKKA